MPGHVKNKVTFPPVVVYFDGKTYWLVDGFHRVAAYRLAGRMEIDCLVIEGTKADAQWRLAEQQGPRRAPHQRRQGQVREDGVEAP